MHIWNYSSVCNWCIRHRTQFEVWFPMSKSYEEKSWVVVVWWSKRIRERHCEMSDTDSNLHSVLKLFKKVLIKEKNKFKKFMELNFHYLQVSSMQWSTISKSNDKKLKICLVEYHFFWWLTAIGVCDKTFRDNIC